MENDACFSGADASGKSAECGVCPRRCRLSEGQTGACHARGMRGGEIVSLNYGCLTSLALDPIEKKPLYHFHPGSRILSAGSFGCNLKCPFCQNCEISCAEIVRETDSGTVHAAEQPEGGGGRRQTLPRVHFTSATGSVYDIPLEYYAPERLSALAKEFAPKGNTGIAFTYNEPLVGFEYVRDTAKLVREAGMKNVLVTAGCITQEALAEVLPYIDAMNIDLKGFTQAFYRDFVGGDLDTVKAFIETAAAHCHVELTTLVIPGENDDDAEMREMTAWIASLCGGRGKDIPYHVSRFFPRHRLTNRAPTDVRTIYRLAELAREKLQYVYEGNC